MHCVVTYSIKYNHLLSQPLTSVTFTLYYQNFMNKWTFVMWNQEKSKEDFVQNVDTKGNQKECL